MKTVSFHCRNRDSEILGIVICIFLFLAGWMVSSAMARHYGDSLLLTVAVPVLFLICGVVYVSRKNKAPGEDGTAQFSESGRVRLGFGGRRVIFDIRNVKKLYYERDTLSRQETGYGYVLVIRLPFYSYRIYSQELTGGDTGFEDTDLYALYLELKNRMDAYERTA